MPVAAMRWLLWFRRSPIFVLHDSIRLDLHQPIRVDEANNLHDGVRRADAPKELAMNGRDPFPVLYADEENSGADHIRKLAAPVLRWRTE